ncbi:hypothetical protein RvY_08929-2 [Ramazzottius varieornatus]|uniref:Uncharacterized protein n=1 Tax=Ramazzottius varieornatus TaxID=947166 RepID=A0A1D1VA51_RAMVA|nr:hypothetical protein RvY_08929-2 [Ramazzottius varieornatus]
MQPEYSVHAIRHAACKIHICRYYYSGQDKHAKDDQTIGGVGVLYDTKSKTANAVFFDKQALQIRHVVRVHDKCETRTINDLQLTFFPFQTLTFLVILTAQQMVPTSLPTSDLRENFSVSWNIVPGWSSPSTNRIQ